MSSEIGLKMNIVVLLRPMFINKHSFKVVSEKVRVGGQVKLEISEKKKATQDIYINTNIFDCMAVNTVRSHMEFSVEPIYRHKKEKR